MMSVQIGPLAFPTAPLLWLAAVMLALLLARSWVRRRAAAGAGEEQAAAAEEAVWRAALAGFVVSRLMFVLPAWPDYAAAPWSVLDIRDGGWAPGYGVLAAAAVAAWHAGRQTPLRAPLAAAGALAMAVWAGGSTLLGLHKNLPVPDVAVVDLRGTPSRLPAIAAGQPTVVNLWATWCAPCRVELPALAAAQASHPAVRFVYLNQGEEAAAVQRFTATLPFRLEGVWLDTRSAAGLAVDSNGLPTTLIFDEQGRLLVRHFGVITEAALRSHLRPWRGQGL